MVYWSASETFSSDIIADKNVSYTKTRDIAFVIQDKATIFIGGDYDVGSYFDLLKFKRIVSFFLWRTDRLISRRDCKSNFYRESLKFSTLMSSGYIYSGSSFPRKV